VGRGAREDEVGEAAGQVDERGWGAGGEEGEEVVDVEVPAADVDLLRGCCHDVS
jgi:hypothetical protein